VPASKRALFASIAFLGAGAAGAVAHAQVAMGDIERANLPNSNFVRDRNISVQDRPKPGYEAIGVPAGSFIIWPKAQLTTEYNDNIYATKDDTVDDLITEVAPQVTIVSDWGRHALVGYARANFARHADYHHENTDDYEVGTRGRLDVTRSMTLNGQLEYDQEHEPRTSANVTDAISPTQFEVGHVAATARYELNRLLLSGQTDFRTYKFNNGIAEDGTVVVQDDRDRNEFVFTGRGDYAISPDTAVFIEATGETRDYKRGTFSGVVNRLVTRDSDGYILLTGANFELGSLTRGEIAVGYMSQSYDDSAFKNVNGFSARVRVEWFPTELTTVTLTGARTIEESAVIGAAGYIASSLEARVDHELLRNVILTGQISYANDDYQGASSNGFTFDRTDDILNFGLSATYLLNRHTGLTFNYGYLKQNSKGREAGRDFTVNQVGLTLVLQY